MCPYYSTNVYGIRDRIGLNAIKSKQTHRVNKRADSCQPLVNGHTYDLMRISLASSTSRLQVTGRLPQQVFIPVPVRRLAGRILD